MLFVEGVLLLLFLVDSVVSDKVCIFLFKLIILRFFSVLGEIF